MPRSPTCYFDSDGSDLGYSLVRKEVLIDEYPNLLCSSKGTTLWTWGNNNFGQLGNNSTVNASSPVQTVSGGTNWKQVDIGFRTAAAIKIDGTLWLWGNNSTGQFGTNSTINASSPVQTISSGTNWKQVSLSTNGDTVAAVKTDGTLWTWGCNVCGQLGNNSIVSASSPIQTVSGGTNWKLVSAGGQATGAIKCDGTLWLWGSNSFGSMLGNNTIINASSPVQTVSGGTNWRQVCVGSGTTAAIKTDGTLWLWGFNSGRLGNNGATGSTSSPVQTVSGGTNWKQVSTIGIIFAIKTDGTLWSWGYNNFSNLSTCTFGMLLDGTAIPRSSPIQTLSGGTNWKQVAISGYNGAAIKTDGTLWTWGQTRGGVLGNPDIYLDLIAWPKNSPIQVMAGGGQNWKQVEVTSSQTDKSGTVIALAEVGDW